MKAGPPHVHVWLRIFLSLFLPFYPVLVIVSFFYILLAISGDDVGWLVVQSTLLLEGKQADVMTVCFG